MMKFAVLFIFLSQLLMAQNSKIIDKNEYYSHLNDPLTFSLKKEYCEETTTMQPPFYTSNKYLPSGYNADIKWSKVFENLRSNKNSKSDIKSILPIGSIVKVNQKISNKLYFEIEKLNQSKASLADDILKSTFPREAKLDPEYFEDIVKPIFFKNTGVQDKSMIQSVTRAHVKNFFTEKELSSIKGKENLKKVTKEISDKLQGAYYSYQSILKKLEAYKYPKLNSSERRYRYKVNEISKAIINISKHGLVPVEVLYTDKSVIKQLEKREIPGVGKINMRSKTSSITPSKKNSKGYINANSLDLHPENKYVFKIRQHSPMFITGTGKNKIEENLSDKILKYQISFDPKLQANVYNVEKCCFDDLKKGALCTFKSYLYDVEDKLGNKLSSKWVDLTPECCTNEMFHFIRPLPKDHYKTFLNLMDAFRDDERYFYAKNNDPEQSLLLAQNIATRSNVTIKRNGETISYRPNSHLNDDLMKIPLYERDTQVFSALDHKKKPFQATAIIRRGPFNTYHYPNHLGEDESNDEWGKPKSVCAFMQIAKHWRDNFCKYNDDRCNIGFGHIYHPQKLGKHDSHQSGECFDIRPFSKKSSKRFQQVSINDKGSGYNKELTNTFIQLLGKSGGTGIIFNDLSIRNENKVNYQVKGHNNHIHVCFKESNDKVRETCKNGL